MQVKSTKFECVSRLSNFDSKRGPAERIHRLVQYIDRASSTPIPSHYDLTAACIERDFPTRPRTRSRFVLCDQSSRQKDCLVSSLSFTSLSECLRSHKALWKSLCEQWQTPQLKQNQEHLHKLQDSQPPQQVLWRWVMVHAWPRQPEHTAVELSLKRLLAHAGFKGREDCAQYARCTEYCCHACQAISGGDRGACFDARPGPGRQGAPKRSNSSFGSIPPEAQSTATSKPTFSKP